MEAVSAREAEVLAAVAAGLTNAQIASRLHVSVRTVESHVSALLRKLGVDDRRALAAVASHPQRPTARMVPAAELVGREAEVAAVAALADAPGLVTIVAPGGSGKTAVALAVAARRPSAFVDLAALPVGAGAELVVGAICAALGVADASGRRLLDVVGEQLSAGVVLVVLDNCEHVLDGVAAVVAELVARRGVRLLATSRERLAVPGEVVHRLPPLEHASAVELFRRRAAAVDPDARLDADLVGPLCERLDRLPLAIELAAARLAVFDLRDLADRLDRSLDLLDGGSRATPRHRSVRDALAWSHDLLDAGDRATYRRISVLAGPSSLSTIEAVVGEVDGLDVATSVAHLVEASLLHRVGRAYRQLDLIRADGRRRLVASGERPAVVDRFVSWALEQLADGEPGSDVLAAFDAALAQRHPRLDQLTVALVDALCDTGRWSEAVAIRERHARETRSSASALLASELSFARWRGDEGTRLCTLAAELAVEAGDERAEVDALATLVEMSARWVGTITTPLGRDALAPHADRVDVIAARWPDDVTVQARHALTCHWSGRRATVDDEPARFLAAGASAPLVSGLYDAALNTALEVPDLPRARRLTRERLPLLARLTGNGRGLLERTDLLWMAADVDVACGRFASALTWAEELAALPLTDDIRWTATQQTTLALFYLGRFDLVVRNAQEAHRRWVAEGAVTAGYLATTFAAAGAVHGYRGDDDAAASWFALARRLRVDRTATTMILEADARLHHHDREGAAACLSEQVGDVRGIMRSRYAATRAEALGGAAIDEAEALAAGDRYADAVLARAKGELEVALAGFQACGARYQAARTSLLLGGTDAAAGRAVYEELGLTS